MQAVGYGKRHLFEVTAVTAASRITNYIQKRTESPIENFLSGSLSSA